MKIASYNIRKAVGLDWRRDGGRIVRVLGEIDADIVVLQEADTRLGQRTGVLPVDDLLDGLGYSFADFDEGSPSHGWHGNGILFKTGRFQLADRTRIHLPTLEPRGAVSALFEDPVFEIVGVHLGLTPRTRRKQLKALSARIDRNHHPTLIAGDFNTASSNDRISRFFGEGVSVLKPGPSFHASLPIAPLDRFIYKGFSGHERSYVHATDLARRASDHLPVVVELEPLPAPTDTPDSTDRTHS